MIDSIEIVYKSAQRNILNRLFTEMLSELPQKPIVVQDIENIDLSKIFSQMDDNSILITNDHYINEKCDFKILNNRGKILLTVSEDGCTINDHSQQEYLEDSMCSKLARLYDVFCTKCTNVFTITA